MATQLVCSTLSVFYSGVVNCEITLRFFQVPQLWVLGDFISPCLVWWLAEAKAFQPSKLPRECPSVLWCETWCLSKKIRVGGWGKIPSMLPSNQERNGRSLFECLFPFSLDCLKYTNTYRISSDATATIFYAVCFCVTILFEGGIYFFGSPQTSTMAW